MGYRGCVGLSQQSSGFRIPESVARMMRQEGIIYVGTSNKAGIPNISPRTAFWITDEGSLVWFSWFQHKTYRNITENNHVCVAVVDSAHLVGYRMNGRVELVADPDKITEVVRLVMTKPRHADFNKMMQSQSGYPPFVVWFRLEELYSLAPVENSGYPMPLS
jgi:hypothetical protein